MRRAIVSGAIANKCGNGGEPWIRLSWALGFKRLGFDVCFVEQITPPGCVDESGVMTSFAASANLAWFQAVMTRFGLEDSCALVYGEAGETWGLSSAELLAWAESADLLLNISGHLTLDSIKRLPRCRVYLDEDPGFTQMWQASGLIGAQLGGHDFYFTLAQNIGETDCSIPTSGMSWQPIRTPVVLEHWPVSRSLAFDRFTTVGSWRGAFGPVTFEGNTYGAKVHEFRKFIDLPRRSGRLFEMALQIHPGDQKDLDALREHGWYIVNPHYVAGTPEAFRRYVQNSSAEFSVAQGIYVQTNSGWFSDRTVRYLASGKPALVQDTGFSRNLPTGEGLVAFRTMEEAVAGAESIAGDYARHCRAARRIAEEYFDSDIVLRKMLQEIGLSGPNRL
jgi:hypothetical protein